MACFVACFARVFFPGRAHRVPGMDGVGRLFAQAFWGMAARGGAEPKHIRAINPETKMDALRNIGIIAHIDAGKTTLSERILFYTEKIHRMGEVHDGNATMDFMPEEQERGITIASSCTTCFWDKTRINIIDTPGHVDFIIEVERSLRVLDGAVGVFCAVGGVEPQSETVWRQSEKYGVPKLAFVNKMDRPGADYGAALESMRARLGARPAPATIPLGQGDEFAAVADIVTMRRLDFDEKSQGRAVRAAPLTGQDLEIANVWRETLLELLADEDEAVMEAYLSGETGNLSPALLDACLRRGCLSGRLVPVFAGSALRNIGVQPLLDGVVKYLPSPAEAKPVEGTLPDSDAPVIVRPDPSDPVAALIFKVVMDAGRPLALVRVYAGSIRPGEVLRNTTQGADERPTRIFRMNADRRESLDIALCGDIVALGGLRAPRTGDTLAAKSRPLILENLDAYKPVISLALEPRNAEEGKKLDEALNRYLVEDPTLRLEVDEATGQRLVSGMGELHLEVLTERIRREYGISPRVGQPQVVHQETIQDAAEASATFERELGDTPHHGMVSLRVEPLPRMSGNIVDISALMPSGGAAQGGKAARGKREQGAARASETTCPRAWADAVRQGLESALQSGAAGGFPVQDVRVTVLSLERKETSTPVGFHMAAVAALKLALERARPVLLEPIMDVEITAPDANVGDVIGLLGSRGGRVESMEEQGAGELSRCKLVKAAAPLRALFGFSTALRSASQGRAGLVMRFSRFDVLP